MAEDPDDADELLRQLRMRLQLLAVGVHELHDAAELAVVRDEHVHWPTSRSTVLRLEADEATLHYVITLIDSRRLLLLADPSELRWVTWLRDYWLYPVGVALIVGVLVGRFV